MGLNDTVTVTAPPWTVTRPEDGEALQPEIAPIVNEYVPFARANEITVVVDALVTPPIVTFQ